MNEKPITTEQLDREYPMYAREMKWKMIENKIAAEYAVKVEQVDLNQYAASVIMQQFGQYNIPEDMIGDFAKRYLEKEENLQKAHEAVKSKKVFDLLNQNVAKDVKVVGYDAFVKIVQEHHHHD
jgi:trigger factor